MKTVAVVSGKGGTGKTTISSLIVRALSGSLSIVCADADVEAANLPIALGAVPESSEPLAGVARATVDADSCTGCGACVEVCRFGAIALEGECAVADPVACEGCGACVWACEYDAVSLVPRDAGEVFVGTCDVGPIVYGRLNPGHDLSGRLVTRVRQRAAEVAGGRGADLVLVDGPPGTGCPAIAALSGCDLALAVAEPSASGNYDLTRLAELTSAMNVPLVVVLNKADLSEPGARGIRELCAGRSISVVAEMPFDDSLAGALGQLASGHGSSLSALDPKLASQAETIGLAVRDALGVPRVAVELADE